MLYFYAIAAGICFALLGLNYKHAEQLKCRPLPFIILFNGVASAVVAVQIPFSHTNWSSPRMWVLSIALGAILFLAIELLLFLNTIGPATLSWTIVNLSLLVPILLTQVFFHEKTTVVDFILIIIFIVMLKLLESGANAAGELAAAKKNIYIIVLSVLFLANGTYQFGSIKIMQYWLPPHSEIAVGVILYAAASLIALIAYLIKYGTSSFTPREIKTGTMAGIYSGTGLAFMMAAATLPAMILYPISQGIALLGGIILTATFYHESLHPTKLLGFACGLLMLTIAIFRDKMLMFIDKIP